MRADETSWPYNNPGGDEPDWAAGDGHPSWPANGNGQNWTAGDDSWPANGNGQDWTAGDDSWPVNGNGNGQDWPYGEDHPSWRGTPPSAWPRISARSRTGGSPGPLGRATRKHHQARTPGQHDQSVTAGKRKN